MATDLKRRADLMVRLVETEMWKELRVMIEERVAKLEVEIVDAAGKRASWETAEALAARRHELADLIDRVANRVPAAAAKGGNQG